MEELVFQVQQSFEESPNARGYALVASTDANEIILNGTVHSFYHKQLIQEDVGRFIKGKTWQGVTINLSNEIVVENGVGDPKF